MTIHLCPECKDSAYNTLLRDLKQFLEGENAKFKAQKVSTEIMVGKASVLDALDEFLKKH